MKVLQIARQFAPSTGGLENAVEGLSRALQVHGYETGVLTLRRIFSTGENAPPHSCLSGLEIVRIPHWGIRRYPIAPQVLGIARKYDILHVHAIDFFADFLSLTRFLHRRPIVVTTHGGIFHTKWLPWFKSAYFRTLTREALKRVHAVVSVSESDHDLFSQIVPAEKLHLIRNGVVLEPYLTVRKEITPGLLVGIGRVAPNKGIDRLIKAVAHVRRSYDPVSFVWIGPDDTSSARDLLNLAEQCGVRDRVHFTGRIDVEVMGQYLSHAHLFVSASSYEGFGLSTLEAMSSGTVPVVTKVGIHPQVIEPARTGFLVDGDERALSDGLLAALQLDLRSLAAIGESARDVSRQFAWSRVVEKYISIYDSALASTHSVALERADVPESGSYLPPSF